MGSAPSPGGPAGCHPTRPRPPEASVKAAPQDSGHAQGRPLPGVSRGDRHATGPRASPRALPPAVTTGSAPPPPGVPRVRRARPPAAERGQLQRGGSLDSPGACSVRGGAAVTGRPAVALEAEAEATLPRPQGQWEPGRGQGGGTGGEGCHRQARPGGRGRSSACDGDGDGDGASRITIALPHVTASPLRGPTATTHPAGPLGLQAPPTPTPRCR